jgi:hypothetical protein
MSKETNMPLNLGHSRTTEAETDIDIIWDQGATYSLKAILHLP